MPDTRSVERFAIPVPSPSGRVLHMTQPDLESLREPDFDRTDLPLMRDILLLRTDQMSTVEELLDGYLEKLHALLSKQLPPAEGGQSPTRRAARSSMSAP